MERYSQVLINVKVSTRGKLFSPQPRKLQAEINRVTELSAIQAGNFSTWSQVRNHSIRVRLAGEILRQIPTLAEEAAQLSKGKDWPNAFI